MQNTASAPKVSVIIPMYNCSRYIGECIDSLKKQTLTDWEVVCVDDGSTDGTLRAARAAADDDARFSFLAMPDNRGQSAARNLALGVITGEYVVLLDADDMLVPEALEHLAQRADEQQLDDLYFSASSFYEDAEARAALQEDYEGRDSFEEVANGRELFAWFEKRDQFYPHAPFRMVRRDLIERAGIRFYEGIIHEDALFTLQTLVESQRSSFLNERLYIRRVRGNSTMTARHSIRNVEGHWACAKVMRDWLDKELDQNPNTISQDFLWALTHRLNTWLVVVGRYLIEEIPVDERAQYEASLAPQDWAALYTDIIQPAQMVIDKEQEYLASATYKLGNVLISAPRAAKNAVKNATALRK